MPTLVSDEKEQRKTEPSTTQPEAPNKSSKFKFILMAVLLIAIGVGGYFWLNSRGKVSSDDAQVDGHILTVAPKISGTVAEVLVNDNQHVKAGEVILRIDPRDYEAKVAQARASLALAQSQAKAAQV